MYWKFLKWGGALAFVAICALAYWSESTPPAPVESAPPTTESPKKFNF